MQSLLTDVHTHSTFSFDGRSTLARMLERACEKGVAFYGVSEHFDYDVKMLGENRMPDEKAAEYFHTARHLQEDYAGCMNVLVGAEFGFMDDRQVFDEYQATVQKYRPDFVVNSVHTVRGYDYYYGKPYQGQNGLRNKREVYAEYLSLVRKSLDVPYSYDIVGHIGYAKRYAPYEDCTMPYSEYAEIIDDILKTIIKKDKILEVNASGGRATCPFEEILRRYFALGGRKISYASDAHETSAICANRESIIALLKEIGFTYITVPCKGEHIKVEI